MDWFDLLAAQGTLKSFLQCHSLKSSIPCCSAFFMVQFSHPYMTTGKIMGLTRWIFVSKVMPPGFNMVSRFVIVVPPRSKCVFLLLLFVCCFCFSFLFFFLIPWPQSLINSDCGVQEDKIYHCFHFCPICLP